VSGRFVTNTQGQQRIHICILEGDAVDPDACTLIGDARITDLPSDLPAGSPVEVTYEYDKNGRISVHAREMTGNQEARIEIQRDSGLDTAGVDAFESLAADYQVE
jgi:molecular chaperone DnaK